MDAEEKFALFVQYNMYVDLWRLNDYINLGDRNGDFRLILGAIPLGLLASRGLISKEIKRFVAYKVDLIQRYCRVRTSHR